MSASSAERKRRRVRVKWDESNLHYLEQTKTPKQKINEPKTPFHQLSLDPDEAAELSPAQPQDGSDSELKGSQRDAAHAAAIASALSEVASSSLNSGDSEVGRSSGSAGWTSSEDEAWDMEHDDMSAQIEGLPRPEFSKSVSFKEHRRRHYDEYRKVKQLGTHIQAMVAEGEGLPNRPDPSTVPSDAPVNVPGPT